MRRNNCRSIETTPQLAPITLPIAPLNSATNTTSPKAHQVLGLHPHPSNPHPHSYPKPSNILVNHVAQFNQQSPLEDMFSQLGSFHGSLQPEPFYRSLLAPVENDEKTKTPCDQLHNMLAEFDWGVTATKKPGKNNQSGAVVAAAALPPKPMKNHLTNFLEQTSAMARHSPAVGAISVPSGSGDLDSRRHSISGSESCWQHRSRRHCDSPEIMSIHQSQVSVSDSRDQYFGPSPEPELDSIDETSMNKMMEEKLNMMEEKLCLTQDNSPPDKSNPPASSQLYAVSSPPAPISVSFDTPRASPNDHWCGVEDTYPVITPLSEDDHLRVRSPSTANASVNSVRPTPPPTAAVTHVTDVKSTTSSVNNTPQHHPRHLQPIPCNLITPRASTLIRNSLRHEPCEGDEFGIPSFNLPPAALDQTRMASRHASINLSSRFPLVERQTLTPVQTRLRGGSVDSGACTLKVTPALEEDQSGGRSRASSDSSSNNGSEKNTAAQSASHTRRPSQPENLHQANNTNQLGHQLGHSSSSTTLPPVIANSPLRNTVKRSPMRIAVTTSMSQTPPMTITPKATRSPPYNLPTTLAPPTFPASPSKGYPSPPQFIKARVKVLGAVGIPVKKDLHVIHHGHLGEGQFGPSGGGGGSGSHRKSPSPQRTPLRKYSEPATLTKIQSPAMVKNRSIMV